jgi:uncharacterized protein YndB with AHSA1/START domain
MTRIQETIAIDADPDRVWAIAGDPGAIGRWLPALASSALHGDERSCTTAGGAELKERVVERNEAERCYVYEITESPMPLASFRSVLSVQGHNGHAHVGWSAEFEATDDVARAELEQTFARIYRDGLESLRAHVEGNARRG